MGEGIRENKVRENRGRLVEEGTDGETGEGGRR